VRTGPSREVGDRWTAWKPVKLTAENAELRGSTDIARRRYMQVEVVLADDNAVLRGISFSDDSESKPNVDIEWSVEARDGDDLHYDLRIRSSGGKDSAWVKLNQDGPLTSKKFKLDLDTTPATSPATAPARPRPTR